MVLKELTCQCLGIRIVTRNVKNAAGRSWEAITTWLYKAISLDSEEYVLSMMALFNRSHPVFWDLMPFEGTRN
jgi:hypothetical protein